MIKLLRPMLAPAMRRVLQDRFSLGELEQVIQGMWRNYDDLAQDLPAEPTLGARIMVRLAAMTVGLHESLREAGLTEEEAGERTSQVTWLVYEKLTGPPWKLTALLAKRRIARVRRVMDWSMRFPYGPPGYQMQYVQAEENTVAFDVHRCPAADYFARQGLSELCVSAFCNLDYPLADKWGVTLERSQTLAGGATHCDFRFRPRCEQKGELMREKLRAALDWLRGFLEAMMGAPAYDEAAFQQQIRELVGGVKKDEQPPHPDR